jgi:hypothetical protein
MTEHDRLFKELLSTFFVEFLDLFLPQVASQIERDSVRFLPVDFGFCGYVFTTERLGRGDVSS